MVIYQKQGSGPLFSSLIPDPGYQREVSLFVGNLNESSTYRFTVLAQNSYNKSSATYSNPVDFETKGRSFLT